ncbi:YeeE/YedE family protein [Vibrio viridaestus]|uniref:YeeE/YedE family protein n=1 Tax=Vibrio viridaestus TaxID=2487322 RepID=A0A3N9TEU1_9VIBR|nr:YeeE/YedE family protein [Vibrio viridaestus]RQW62550.1 YeeE/YedE family protein [Vibrio viridaestus]
MKTFLFYCVATLCGLIFGMGMVISQMVNPDKVIGFLDITGDWDMTLMFVMLGALMVFTPFFWFIVRQRAKPLLAEAFSISNFKAVNARLVIGASIFGIGWGIAGVCPGPSLTRIGLGGADSGLFFVSMILGLAVTQWLLNKHNEKKERYKLSLDHK